MSEPKAKEVQVAVVRCILGEPLRFEVASKSHPGSWYLCDLGAYNGEGKCSCIRWDTVSWPLIRDTRHLPPGRRCRHLRAAREMALNLTIKQYLEEHPNEQE